MGMPQHMFANPYGFPVASPHPQQMLQVSPMQQRAVTPFAMFDNDMSHFGFDSMFSNMRNMMANMHRTFVSFLPFRDSNLYHIKILKKLFPLLCQLQNNMKIFLLKGYILFTGSTFDCSKFVHSMLSWGLVTCQGNLQHYVYLI